MSLVLWCENCICIHNDKLEHCCKFCVFAAIPGGYADEVRWLHGKLNMQYVSMVAAPALHNRALTDKVLKQVLLSGKSASTDVVIIHHVSWLVLPFGKTHD